MSQLVVFLLVRLSAGSRFDPTKLKHAMVVISRLLAAHGHQFAAVKPSYETKSVLEYGDSRVQHQGTGQFSQIFYASFFAFFFDALKMTAPVRSAVPRPRVFTFGVTLNSVL